MQPLYERQKNTMNMRLAKIIIPPFILACITFVAYFSSLFYDFQFDDNLAILRQFNIRHDTFFSLFFKDTRWIGDWINALNFAVNKFDPLVFRSTNLIIHILAVIAVFFLLQRALSLVPTNTWVWAQKNAITYITALLFALHPVQTQTVSYIIQGRLEGLSAFFILTALICFIIFTQSTRTVVRWLLISLLFILIACACGTKEISIVVPILLLLVDWFFVSQGSWKKFKQQLPLHGVFITFTAAIYLYFKKQFIMDVLTLNVTIHNNVGNILTDAVTDPIKPISFFLSQFKVILHYLWIFIWPFNMSVEYDWKLSKGFFAFDCFVPFFILAFIAIIVTALLKKNKTNLVGFGMLWFIICVLPRSSIIPSGELLADYKTYLASVGIFFVFALGLSSLGMFITNKLTKNGPMKKRLLIIFGTILTLVLATLTWQRNKVWQSDLVFWKAILTQAPGKARAHNNYAIALLKIGHYQEAIPYLKQALRLQQGHYWDPYTNLSIAYSSLGKIDLAIKAIKQALRINPYHPESFNSLGLLFNQKQQLDDAQKAFEVSLALRPHYGKAQFNLGRIYVQKNDYEKAWEYFKNCCTKGDFDTVPDGFAHYASMSMYLKKFDDAIIGYQKVLEFDPHSQTTYINLGNAYYYKEDFDRAYEFYQKAAELCPHDFRPLSNLAQIQLKKNHPEKALDLLNKARSIPGSPLELELKIAHCLDVIGNHEAALQILKKCAQQHEDLEVKERARILLKEGIS